MKTIGFRDTAVRLRDQNGIALPLALLGLVLVSVLVTGALITSSTEAAIGGAHRDAVTSLYNAETAAEEFWARNYSEIWYASLGAGIYTAGEVGNSSTHDIAVSRLSDQFGDVGERRVTTSLIASPSSGGGRSLGLLLTHLLPPQLETNIDEGAIFGANATISGRASISDGSDGDGEICELGAGSSAIRYGSDVETPAVEGSAEITGEITQAEETGQELIASALGGEIGNIRNLSQFAQIKFGNSFGTRTYTRNGASDQDPRVSSVDHPTSSPFNWGCPGAMDDAQDCEGKGHDTERAPSVAIDAEGGTVKVQGWHGQGTLMVINGNLEIDGNFNYRGIVLVEGDIRIAGSGQNMAKIEGSVIAGGDVAVTDEESGSEIEGRAVIRYNACAIEDAERGFYEADRNAIHRSGWFEVVR